MARQQRGDRLNCLTENGEYGFNVYSTNDVSPSPGARRTSPSTTTKSPITTRATGKRRLVVPHHPAFRCTGAGQYAGCGCSGGGKFWASDTGQSSTTTCTITIPQGLWADTNNTGFQIQDNYFAANWGSGVTYEISYNALMSGNMFVDNAWGAALQPRIPVNRRLHQRIRV